MPLKPRLGYSTPNVDGQTGPDRIFPVQMDGGVIFARRGGKAVDKHGGYFRLATANSSNLAGFACTENWPKSLGATHPASLKIMSTTGMDVPVNFHLQCSFIFPTSNRPAVEGDRGHDFDIVVPGQTVGTPVQCINMASSAQGILRVSQIMDQYGDFVACTIPPGKRYGNL